ncbi:hypothetical protein ACIQZO_19755 [Streptomyces sp. NPDC097617]|uniref:hypothetical protein n=1 Tax=Streptomyces sp. NPDC097617 TaxID=3366091 RepID=UPI003817DA55
MTAVAQWPPRTRDTRASLEAYERVLGWPLIVDDTLVSARCASAALELSLDAVVSTTCSAFDAVTVPYAVGADLLVLLGRGALDQVPALAYGREQVVVLVAAGTGSGLKSMAGVLVESGPGGRLILPPSPRRRWDTPPWSPRAEEPCPLPTGGAIETPLRIALRSFGAPPPP